MHVDLQYAKVATVREVGSERGELGEVLQLEERQVRQNAHPLGNLRETGVAAEVDPVQGVDTRVQVVSRQVIQSLCLVVACLLVGPSWSAGLRYPRVRPAPGAVEDAELGVEETIVREIEFPKVRTVPFQDVRYGTKTVVGHVESFEGGYSEDFLWKLQEEIIAEVYVRQLPVLDPRHGNGEEGQPDLDKVVGGLSLRSELVDQLESHSWIRLRHANYGREEESRVEVVEIFGHKEKVRGHGGLGRWLPM